MLKLEDHWNLANGLAKLLEIRTLKLFGKIDQLKFIFANNRNLSTINVSVECGCTKIKNTFSGLDSLDC